MLPPNIYLFFFYSNVSDLIPQLQHTGTWHLHNNTIFIQHKLDHVVGQTSRKSAEFTLAANQLLATAASCSTETWPVSESY